jgi:hypothetical protein
MCCDFTDVHVTKKRMRTIFYFLHIIKGYSAIGISDEQERTWLKRKRQNEWHIDKQQIMAHNGELI